MSRVSESGLVHVVEKQILLGDELLVNIRAQLWNLEDVFSAVVLGLHRLVEGNERAVRGRSWSSSESWSVSGGAVRDRAAVTTLSPDEDAVAVVVLHSGASWS